MAHQEEMERIRSGQKAAAKPTPVPVVKNTLWDTYSGLGETAIDEIMEENRFDVFNAFPLVGEVLEIRDAKKRLVIINVGKNLGVRKGDDFNLLDGSGLPFTQMEVKEVGDMTSVAKHKKDHRVKKGINIKAKNSITSLDN